MSKVGLASVPSSFWIRGRQDNPFSDGQYPSMEHAVQRLVLISAPTPASVGVSASALLMVTS
jgi:hypothetical protein